MGFMSVGFLLSFLVFITVFYLVNERYRYLFVLGASFVFYYVNSKGNVIPLAICAFFAYIGGMVIEKTHNKGLYILFFILEISILAFYKYTYFVVSKVLLKGEESGLLNWAGNIVVPVGISYFIFQSITYLGDVYKGNLEAEKNVLKLMTFIAFFPTILSGPVQKARNLLPKLVAPQNASDDEIMHGMHLLIYGLAIKLFISIRLSNIVGDIFHGENTSYYPMTMLIGAAMFSMYIYADFSSYSDMARGICFMMGIDIDQNFRFPYLSTSLAEFWRRWHISLSEWFKEYVYIPLGGSRKGIARTCINLMIVFLLSGLWHGTNWNFLVWGGINGLLVVMGLLLKPIRKYIYTKLKLDGELWYVIAAKRLFVFVMISFTWLFFNNTLAEVFDILTSISRFRPIMLFDRSMLEFCGTALEASSLIIVLLLWMIVQVDRNKKNSVYDKFREMPIVMQTIIVSVLLAACIIGMLSPSAEINTSFLYYRF